MALKVANEIADHLNPSPTSYILPLLADLFIKFTFFFQAPESYKNVTDVVNTCKLQAMFTELQSVVDLPPNLNFMVSPFLILTQCKITEKTAGQGSAYQLSV